MAAAPKEVSLEEVPQYLRVYVGQLRQSSAATLVEPRFIANEPGIGYRFIEP